MTTLSTPALKKADSLRRKNPDIQLKNAREIQEKFRAESQARVRRAFEDVPILIYSMGKDGSSTVFDSLEDFGFADRLFHIHSLDMEKIAQSRIGFESEGVRVPRMLHECDALVEQMRLKPAHPIKVITLVRDPLAREVSALFQNFRRVRHRHIVNADGTICPYKATDHLTAEITVERPCQLFFSWFRAEPRSVFGIDVFDVPFPQDRGWRVYRQGSVDMLLIQLENLSRVGSEAITDFLESPTQIPIQTSHVQTNEVYPHVKNSWKVPLAVCESIFDSTVMRHLYSEEQRAKMIKRWSLADETPARAAKRVRDALQREIAVRRAWEIKERNRLIAESADGRTMVANLHREIDELHAKLTELQQRVDIEDRVPGPEIEPNTIEPQSSCPAVGDDTRLFARNRKAA